MPETRKRRGLSPEGREKLRQAAVANRPWEHSTGPRTPEGKARSAANGKVRQKGPYSTREIQRMVEPYRQLLVEAKTVGGCDLRRSRLGSPYRVAPAAAGTSWKPGAPACRVSTCNFRSRYFASYSSISWAT